MKKGRTILGVIFVFWTSAMAQTNAPDYKQQAFEIVRADFFSHVTVVNDDIYFFKGSRGQFDDQYWGQYLDQFKDIKFTYAEDLLDKADKLNGVNWRGEFFVTAGVGRIYYAEDRYNEYSSTREGSVYQWSDWNDYADKPIVQYKCENRNSQWIINTTFHRRQSSWWPDEKWEAIVLIPSTLIPDGTRNVDLAKLYKSLAPSSQVKSNSPAPLTDSSGQAPKDNTPVKPGFRLKIGGKSVIGGE